MRGTREEDDMGSDLTNRFAIYPMTEESEATGVVAGVYAQLLASLPFVPSLFKSLALCPSYLVLAHEQASSVMQNDRFQAAAKELSDSVRDVSAPPGDAQVRQTLSQFVAPLGRMLLLSSGLLLALDGRLDVAAAPGSAPAPQPLEPERQQPSQWQAPAQTLYGEIRAALQTPVVNTIWRTLAGKGQLEAAWRALGPQVASTREAADELQRAGMQAAVHVPWTVGATPAALQRAGVADAAPGIAAVLDAYVKTLPRVLVLAGSSAPR
jgi:hypothetical protein